MLIAGFGGLLLLMAFAEADGLNALGRIRASNNAISEGFLRRSRALERIRSDLYLSGSYVRDYLLEPDAGRAEGHRDSLIEARTDMDSAVRDYRSMLNAQEIPEMDSLVSELAGYWRTLNPVFQWTPTERQHAGYTFLRDEVFPRRAAMLAVADRIRSINESQLNAGREAAESVFSHYRTRLALIVGFTVSLGLLLAVFSVRRILRLESESAARFEEIAAARSELKRLSARLVDAQETERKAISRELHDEVGQSLTAVLVEMANLSAMIRQVPGASEKAGEIKHLAEHSLAEVRNMALLLRPSMLDDLGLIPALEWQAREVSKRCGLFVRVEAKDVPEDLPEEHKTCIYRLVQESLHNAVQHAGASKAEVSVRMESGHLLLAITDNGRGFDASRKRGLGIAGMHERVANLGGSLTVESQPGSGTVIRAALPLEALESA